MDDRIVGGITALDALAIVFIVLKLLGKVTWSWWWVLAPVWIPVILLVVVFLVALLVFLYRYSKSLTRLG